MRNRLLLGVCAGMFTVVGGMAFVLAQGSASGVTTGTFTIGAPTLIQVASSTHNGSLNPVCGSQIGATAGSEFNGVLENGAGSYIGGVHVPQGATITALGLTAQDFTSPADVHVFLVRKSALAQANFTGKYSVVASVSSSGAVDQARLFSSSTITNPVVDNSEFAYYVEMVNCDETIQPIAIQITYTTP